MFQPRILYLLNSLAHGGAERGVVELVRQGAFAGCDLRIAVLAEGAGAHREALANLGAPPVNLSGQTRLTVWAMALAAVRLFKLIWLWRPNAVVLSLPQANLLGRIMTIGAGVRILSFEHNSRLAKRAYEWGYWLTSDRVDWMLADASETARAAGTRLYRSPPAERWVLPLVVFDGRPNFRPIWGAASGEPFQIIAVGRLVDFKNHRLLVEAADHLREVTGLPFRLTIYGEGEEHDGLAAMIEERGLGSIVSLPGFSSVWPAGPGDLFVLPSANEGLSLATLEAMFAGIPILASNVGELVTYGDAVELIDLSHLTPHLLSCRILALMNDAGRRSRLQSEGATLVERRFGKTAAEPTFRAFNRALLALRDRNT